MTLLEFNLKLKTSKTSSDFILAVNDILGSSFDVSQCEKVGEWTIWKSVIFGLELSITYFSDIEEYYIEGFPSTKIMLLAPSDLEIKQTDISREMLNFFQLSMPEENWFLST